MNILLIHGPNLNLLGERELSKYGNVSSETLLENLRIQFNEHKIEYFQSNIEGELINAVHNSRNSFDGIIINAGAFSHTSLALADAIKAVKTPCFCVHITNIYQREAYRQTDLIGEACAGAIVGLGIEGYRLAMECLLENIGALGTLGRLRI